MVTSVETTKQVLIETKNRRTGPSDGLYVVWALDKLFYNFFPSITNVLNIYLGSNIPPDMPDDHENGHHHHSDMSQAILMC